MTSLSLPISIDDLLRGRNVEWERIEYKRGWNPEDVVHSICAFANDFHNLGGGYIIVGIEEKDGRPVLPPTGINPDKIDEIQKEILNLGHNSIQPMYHPITAPYEIDGKWILAIWVPGGETRPYKTKISLGKDAKDWAYYIRKQSSTVKAKGDNERELLSLTATVPFDDRYNQSAAVEELSHRLMTDFLKEVGSDLAEEAASLSNEELGRQMNVVGGPKEASFPKNVGLLFFNEQPDKYFPATQIDVVWFPEDAGGDKFSEKIFKGPLDRMTREALDYIKRNYISETVIKHQDRAQATRVENFPYPAIEEAIVNAVYHRGYDVREPVEIRIHQEEMVILSYPGPDRSVNLENLRLGKAQPRRYRNRRIGEFFKELDMTEGRSTGIPKIIKAMKENGSPPPEFEFDADYSYFMVTLPIHPKAVEVISKRVTELDGTKLALSRHQVEILEKSFEPVNLTELIEITGRSDRTKFRNQVLNPLLDSGLLEMTIPDKPTSRNQKYRLTENGRKYLENR